MIYHLLFFALIFNLGCAFSQVKIHVWIFTRQRKEALRQLAKAHTRVANICKNAMHQAATVLTRTKSVIVLENLNVSGMLKNHYVVQAMADVGMYELRWQLTYKGA